MSTRPFTRVVVGVDDSETALQALRWATERLGPGGRLHVVHVGDADASDAAPGWLDRATNEAGAPTDTIIDIRLGDPAKVLIDEASRAEAELIVVGAHGSGRRRRWAPFIGSVTGNLLHHCDIPLVVHHGEAKPIGGPVVGCLGFGRPAEAVARWAAHYAQSAGCPLELLHAVSRRPLYPIDSPTDMLGSYLGPGLDREWAAEDLQDLADELQAGLPGLDVSATVASGSAVNAIVAAAGSGDEGAELVVLGQPSGPVSDRLPVSARARQVIARAACPTAIVPACTLAS